MGLTRRHLVLLFCGLLTISTNGDLTCFGHFCLEENYDKLLPPANCTNVTVHSFLFEIFEVDDMNFDISLDVRFELSWIDDRIMYKEKLQRVSSNILRNQSKSRTEQIEKAPITLTDNIWLPSLILRHMKRDNTRKGFFSTPASVDIDVVTMTVNITIEIKPVITCHMHFTWYPFDIQHCKLRMQSQLPVDKLNLVTDEQFRIEKTFVPNYQNVYLEYNVNLHPLGEYEFMEKIPSMEQHVEGGDHFGVFGFVISLRRKWSRHIFIYYFPSALCVIVSWASFFIPLSFSIAARSALLVTLFLSLTTVISYTITSTPASSEIISALTVWFLIHYTFIFLAIMAFVFLLGYRRHSKKSGEALDMFNKKADTFILKLFVALYVIFTVIYWIVISFYCN